MATGTSVSGTKASKERISVGLAANATGTDKLKPVIIGCAKRPRCFGKSFNPEIYGHYFYNTKAWMTSLVFSDWIHSLDRQMRLSGRNVILLVDNASSHSSHKVETLLTNITLHFLKPGITAHIQPMDTGIIRAFKAHYRRFLTKYFLECVDENHPMTVDVRQAMCFIKQSWCCVTQSTIQPCWRHVDILPQQTVPSASDPEEDCPYQSCVLI